MSTGFDRVRRRAPDGPTTAGQRDAPPDSQGKRALFSAAATGTPAAPALGSVVVDCSACGGSTVLSTGRALRLALPSFHFGFGVAGRGRGVRLGLLPRAYPSWMRCPACRRRTWVRLTFQV